MREEGEEKEMHGHLKRKKVKMHLKKKERRLEFATRPYYALGTSPAAQVSIHPCQKKVVCSFCIRGSKMKPHLSLQDARLTC